MEELVDVQGFVEHYHPDKTIASHSINILNDNAMSHFRNIDKFLLDTFLVRQRPSESSGAKRQKREREKDSYLMFFLWKRTQ